VEIIPISDHLTAIDHNLLARPGVGVTYVVRGEQIALVETGTSLTVPFTLAGLERLGIAREEVAHILCTHVHMDHAGGAGYLADALPNATVYIHSTSMPHLIEPSRLLLGVRRAVGEEAWPLHGDILPIPPERLQPSENLSLDLGKGILLEAQPTPGHSPDHVAYWDRKSGGLFIGDAVGLCLPRYNLTFPVTPVPTYNLAAHRATIATLRQQNISQLYITHFGVHQNVAELFTLIHNKLEELVGIVDDALAKGIEDVPALTARWLPYPPEAPGALVARSWGEMSIVGLLRYEKKQRGIS